MENLAKIKGLLGEINNYYQTDDILASFAPEQMEQMLGNLDAELKGAGNDEDAKYEVRKKWLESSIGMAGSVEGRHHTTAEIKHAQGFSKSEILARIDNRRRKVETEIKESETLVEVIRKELAVLRRKITELEQKVGLTKGEHETLKLFQTKYEQLRTNLRNTQYYENELRDKLEKLDAEEVDVRKR